MAFKFKITNVEKLPGAGIGVIDGTVVAGMVTPGQEVVLIHQGQRFPLQVAGVVLEPSRAHRNSAELSISFKLEQPAFAYAQAGDELVPHSPRYCLFICTPARASVAQRSPTPYSERMTFDSKIWAIETISARPIYVLTQWQAFECQVGRSISRSRHFVGAPGGDINPVVSGAILRFNPETACGATASDKVYQLDHKVGLCQAGENIWSIWMDANKATHVVDVSDEVAKLLDTVKDTFEVDPKTFDSLGIRRTVKAMTNDEIRDLIREGEESGSTAQLRQHMDFAANYASNQNHWALSQEAHQRASARRRLAGVFLRDAQRVENSLRTRADIAFDATYLCALACLDIAADECEHPSPDVLMKATGLLELTADQIQPAIAYAQRRYEPIRTEEQCQVAYKELLALAKKVLKTK